MKRNLIIFDIDDTLTKSAEKHQEAYLNTMIHLGFFHINTNWGDYLHHTDSYILKINYENNFDENFNSSFIDRFENSMLENLQLVQPITEVKGANKMLTLLAKNASYAITFATGSLLKPALLKLKQAKLPFNNALLSASNTALIREDVVKEAIEKAKLFYDVDEFAEIISVGDGIWDLKTAKNLGLHFLGIGKKHQIEFKEQGAVCIKDWTEFKLLEIEKKLFLDKAITG